MKNDLCSSVSVGSASPLCLLFKFLANRNIHFCQEKTKAMIWEVSSSVIAVFLTYILISLQSSSPEGQPTGDACCYLLWLNNCMAAKLERGQ